MLYRKAITVAFFCLSFLIAVSGTGKADDGDTPVRELLLMEEIPVVITPSRVAQPVLESPSTITVLTKEDIRRYGLKSFSDLLRNVAGMDVLSITATDRNISVRGLNQLATGRILTLVDNRATYLDIFGLTLWEFLPVPIDEIDRVEIIKGQGSALYGSNAFDGVINIITSPNTGENNTKIIAEVDQLGKVGGSIIHGGEINRLGYKMSIGWDRISGWDGENENGGENKRFRGNLNYAMDAQSSLSLTVIDQERSGDMIVVDELESATYDVTASYVAMDYERSDLKCSVFWRQNNADPKWIKGARLAIEDNSYKAEIQDSFSILNRNFVTLGANYLVNQVGSEVIGGWRSEGRLAVFAQDQISVSRSLKMTLGIRYDRHPLTGNNYSPRGSIVYSPAQGHALRLSIGEAFRNPRFFFSYANLDFPMELPPMFTKPFNVSFKGNRELSPECLRSFEIGYQGVFGSRFRGELDIFLNRLIGLSDFVTTSFYNENDLFPGSPGGTIPATVSVANTNDAESRGGEISVDSSITGWLSARANYSYQYVTNLDTGERIECSPIHKLNISLFADLGQSTNVSLFANYVDETLWEGDLLTEKVDSYTLLNFAASHRLFGSDSEIALSVFNLLNNRHSEYTHGTEVGRSVLLKLIHRM